MQSREKKIQDLIMKYEKLILLIAKNQKKKYFRPKTLYNLIFHLKNIENKEDFERIYSGIDYYLDLSIENKDSMDREISSELYDNQLKRIVTYYNIHFGFRYYSFGPALFMYILLVMTLFLFSTLFYTEMIGGLMALLLVSYYYVKWKNKKIYGIFY
jgi:hypothetical protein